LWHLFWSCSYSRVARHRREQEKAVSRDRLGSERDEHFIDFFSYRLMLYTSTAAARYCRVLAGLLQHTPGCSSLLLIIAAFCSVEVFTVIRPRPSQCRVLPLVTTPRNGAEQCDERVCLSVSARISQEPQVQTSNNTLYLLPVAVARSTYGRFGIG